MAETASTRRKRRGLVISGGGAKGAYSFGCLRALREDGLEFEAVSATSAGALNGAIWSTQAFEEGERLWRQMTPAKSYTFKGPLALLPTFVARRLFLAILLIGMTASHLIKGVVTPEYEGRVAKVAAGLAAALGTLIFAFWSQDGLVAWSYLYFLIGCLALHQGLAYDHGYGQFIGYVLIFGSLASITSGAIATLAGSPRNWLYYVSFLPVMALEFAAARLFVHFLSLLTAFSSKPLRRTIENFLSGKDMKIPFFATVAQSARVFDPDRPRWAATGPGRGIDQYSPLADAVWIPKYVRVDQLPERKRIDVLTATAALPFGVVASVCLDGQEFVDGGLADNEPVAPLLPLGLDEIWLLLLGPEVRDESEREAECLELLRRPALLACKRPEEVVGRYPDRTHNSPPRIVPYPRLPSWPRLRVMGPSASLGDLFDGLLNFTPAYAERLIEAGYRDAQAFLEKGAGQTDDAVNHQADRPPCYNSAFGELLAGPSVSLGPRPIIRSD